MIMKQISSINTSEDKMFSNNSKTNTKPSTNKNKNTNTSNLKHITTKTKITLIQAKTTIK